MQKNSSISSRYTTRLSPSGRSTSLSPSGRSTRLRASGRFQWWIARARIV